MTDLPAALRRIHTDDTAAHQAVAAAWQSDPQALVALLNDSDDGLRCLTADALGLFADGSACAALRACLADGEPAIAGHAADALAQIARRHPETLPDAVAALEPLAASDHRWLRVAVLQALAEMARSDERAAPAAVHGLLAALVRAETQAVYELTLETLLAIGPNARPALEEATRSAPPEQRDQARYAYARLL